MAPIAPSSGTGPVVADTLFADLMVRNPIDGEIARTFLLDYQEWSIPVVCRDVNLQHQAEVRLMYAPDILDFVRHELCCELWDEHDLIAELTRIFQRGGGTFDPAVLIQGESDFGSGDKLYGYVPTPTSDILAGQDLPHNTYHFRTDEQNDPLDLALQVMRRIDKQDGSVSNARRLLHSLERGPRPDIDGPTIQHSLEDEPDCVESVPVRYVGSSGAGAGNGRRRDERGTRARRTSAGHLALWSGRVASPLVSAVQTAHTSPPSQSRRCKQGKRAGFDILLLNSSGPPQLLAALATCEDSILAIANQEHQCRGLAFTDLQHDASAAGWRLHGAQAAATAKDGTSSGVSIAVRKTVGHGDVHGAVDHSPHASPGRLSALWVQVGPDTGLILMTIYLYHSEGLSARNARLVEHAVAVAKSYGSPWLICGDLNMAPDEFSHLFGYVLEMANAFIFAPDEPTHCPSGGTARTLDFLICADTVSNWIDNICVDHGVASKPHRAVRVSIKADRHNYTFTKLCSPKQFPRSRPIGCARIPVLPDWARRQDSFHGTVVAENGSSGYVAPGDVSISDLWLALVHAIECELCGITDSVFSDGKELRAFLGRGSGIRFAQRLALPKRSSAKLGKVDATAHALRWFADRVKELAAVSRKLRDGVTVTATTARQCDNILGKLSADRGLASIVRSISSDWNKMVTSVCQHRPGYDSELLFKISQCADEDAVERKKQQAERRASSWRSHVAKQLVNGAAATHRWVKRDIVPSSTPDTVGDGRTRTASPQALVDHDLPSWKAIWNRDVGGDDPWRRWSGLPSDDQLPPITANEIRRAARSFRTGTSVGCDALPPAVFGWLSDPLCEAVAHFLNVVESSGKWPETVATSLVHLIPKPGGGRRPIGVLPTIVRIWERVRKPVSQKWARENKRDFDWASQGRSAESAAWHQSLLDEAALGRGHHSAGVFLDLTKAFEMVRLEDVWYAGLHYGFPPTLLRVALEAFAFARRLYFQYATSEPVYSVTAILAGGGFAQISLLLVLLRPLDRLVAQYHCRHVSFCVYVDDIGIHASGPVEQVKSELSLAAAELVDILETDLAMRVSRREQWATEGPGKTVAAASSLSLARRLSTPMRRLGIKMQRKIKHLGVTFRPGARTKELSGKASRWKTTATRRARIVRLGRRLGSHIFKTAVTPAALYGSTVEFPRIGTIKCMRRDAARSFGPLNGRSITARLAVYRADPALLAITKSVAAWASAVWDGSVTPAILQSAWKHACVRNITSRRPNTSAGGAAGSYIAALHRIQWTSPSYDHVQTRDGTIVNLSSTAPYTVLQYLTDDFHIVSAAATNLAARLTRACSPGGNVPAGECGSDPVQATVDGTERSTKLCGQPLRHNGSLVPWFSPIASVLNSSWAALRSPSAVASAAALPEGGWWTQEQLAAKDLAADPYCRACITDTSSVVGSLWHRVCDCAGRDSAVSDRCPRKLRELARNNPLEPLFADGVPLQPLFPPAPVQEEHWIGKTPKDGVIASGQAYTDGALRGTIPRANRAGWAYIVDDGSEGLWGKYGVCAEDYTSVLRSELRALLELLRVTAGPLTVHVDNKTVVDGIKHGRKWCCDARREGADLWRQIWDRLEEMPCQVDVVKVKAHMTYQDALSGRISWATWLGNAVADKWAKAGSAAAARQSPASSFHAQWNRARVWYKWLVTLAENWTNDTEHSGPILEPHRTGRVRPQPRPDRDHEIWRNSSRAWCRLCGATGPWAPDGPPPVPLRRPCRGSMVDRAKVRHRLLARPPLRAATDDGAVSYSALRSRGAALMMQEPEPFVTDRQGSGYAARESYSSEVIPVLAEEELPPSPFGEDPFDEDPFGFANFGMDDGERAGRPHTDDVPVVAEAPDPQRPHAAHASHRLRQTLHILWCQACGRSAIQRLGVGLLRPCCGVASGSYPARIRRLTEGRHPVTGELV